VVSRPCHVDDHHGRNHRDGTGYDVTGKKRRREALVPSVAPAGVPPVTRSIAKPERRAAGRQCADTRFNV
jgi:hypothetical protein